MGFSTKISEMQLERIQNEIILTHQSQMEYLFPEATQASLGLFMQFSQHNICLQIRLKSVKMQNYKEIRGINSGLYVSK